MLKILPAESTNTLYRGSNCEWGEGWVELEGVALCRIGDCEQGERWVESKGVAQCRVSDCEQGERWVELEGVGRVVGTEPLSLCHVL